MEKKAGSFKKMEEERKSKMEGKKGMRKKKRKMGRR